METNKWMVGVDLGGTTIKMAFIDQSGNLKDKWEIPTDVTDEGKNITRDIAQSINEHLKELGQPKEQLLGIGMGAPGFMDIENGLVYEAVNIGWKDYHLKKELAEASGLPVFIDNDANLAALGEMWKGAGEGATDLLCVTVGTGVGGGVIVNGNIVHGVGGMAGEIGHITVEPDHGVKCNCGRIGCLETVASATGIRRLAFGTLEHYPTSVLNEIYNESRDITAKDVLDAAKAQDTYAIMIIEKAAVYLGLALANIGIVLNPKKIVLGGGVSKAGDTFIKPVEHYLRAYSHPRIYNDLELVTATLGNDAGVYGGAWLVMNNVS